MAVLDRLVLDALRDVGYTGAEFYSQKKDADGTYEIFHGGLITIRPTLHHRPSIQKMIDAGFAAAEKETADKDTEAGDE